MHVIDAISKEKGIAPEILIDALERAMATAMRTHRHTAKNERIEARLDRLSGQLAIVAVKEVVEVVMDPGEEIAIQDAQKYYPDVEIGEEVEIPKDADALGRIGAQKAKQIITQLVREAEREIILSTFGGKIGEIVNGHISRMDRRRYFVDIGRAEGVLNFNDCIPGEKYRRGDRVQVVIQAVDDAPQGPVVVLSRTSPEFMRKRFEMEVPEIAEGTIEIHTIVRDPGVRAKMSVISKDRNVDPVGACVGVKGSRVQSIVRDLMGENIDIIPYTENLAEYVTHALSPARVSKVKVNHEEESIEVLVDDDQLSLAIGRRGQNVRLAHRLIGWKIDIYSPNKLEELGLDIFNEELVANPFVDGAPVITETSSGVENPFKDLPETEVDEANSSSETASEGDDTEEKPEGP